MPLKDMQLNGAAVVDAKSVVDGLDSVAAAYVDYPMFNYILGRKRSSSVIKLIIKASLLAIGRDCICISAGENNAAVAIFIRPDYKGVGTLPFLLKGGLKLIFCHSPGILFRLSNYEKNAVEVKKRYVDGDCWYLYSLTVRPDCRGRGLATKVMKPMLDYLDAAGQSCYLETNKESNTLMYQHFGFKLMEEGTIPGTDVPHYAMRRDPQKATTDKATTNATQI